MTFFIRYAKGFALPLALAAVLALQGCGANSNFTPSVDAPSDNSGQSIVSPPNSDSPTASVPIKVAPLWEKPRAESGVSWTKFSSTLILTEAPDLMKGTADVTKFCPSYYSLTTDEKVNFWVYLVSAVTKYESSFDPVSRLKETGLGTDSVTKLPVYSEGLLQLSYQDGKNYSFCNEFNWDKDKSLNPTDPKKTILDPIKNLRCGIRIMNKIMGKHNLIAFDSGNYWSTLMPKRATVNSIRTLTAGISICR